MYLCRLLSVGRSNWVFRLLPHCTKDRLCRKRKGLQDISKTLLIHVNGALMYMECMAGVILVPRKNPQEDGLLSYLYLNHTGRCILVCRARRYDCHIPELIFSSVALFVISNLLGLQRLKARDAPWNQTLKHLIQSCSKAPCSGPCLHTISIPDKDDCERRAF